MSGWGWGARGEGSGNWITSRLLSISKEEGLLKLYWRLDACVGRGNYGPRAEPLDAADVVVGELPTVENLEKEAESGALARSESSLGPDRNLRESVELQGRCLYV